jgi:hypothetical protein
MRHIKQKETFKKKGIHPKKKVPQKPHKPKLLEFKKSHTLNKMIAIITTHACMIFTGTMRIKKTHMNCHQS